MKKWILSVLAICAATCMLSCQDPPNNSVGETSVEQQEEMGQVSVSVDLGTVGVLARSAQMTPNRLVLQLVSNKADTIKDTQLISGRSSIARIYSLPSQRHWTLTVTGRDQRDSVLYSGRAEFDVQPRATLNLNLSLDAAYSSIRARFPILDSATRFVMLVDGQTWADSQITRQTRVGDTIKADHDYLTASASGIAHRFTLRVYGRYWGIDTVMYSLDTTLLLVSGRSATILLALKYVGPYPAPAGALNLQVALGSVGQLVLEIGYGSPADYGSPWNPSVAYGRVVDFRDSQVYRTIKVGTRTWMAQNLNYAGIGGESFGACYDGKASLCAKYGRLYTWSEAVSLAQIIAPIDPTGIVVLDKLVPEDPTDAPMDPSPVVVIGKPTNPPLPGSGICPAGWHLPSNAEWTTFVSDAKLSTGYQLKAVVGWSDPGTDVIGFRALRAGDRNSTGASINMGTQTYFWTSTENNSQNAWLRALAEDYQDFRNYADLKTYGFSVRCVQD